MGQTGGAPRTLVMRQVMFVHREGPVSQCGCGCHVLSRSHVTRAAGYPAFELGWPRRPSNQQNWQLTAHQTRHRTRHRTRLLYKEPFAMEYQPRSEIIKNNPIGNSLDAFRTSFPYMPQSLAIVFGIFRASSSAFQRYSPGPSLILVSKGTREQLNSARKTPTRGGRRLRYAT